MKTQRPKAHQIIKIKRIHTQMEHNLHNLFKNSNAPELPEGFTITTLEKIARESHRIERNRKIYWGIASLVSVVLFVSSTVHTVGQFGSSGFSSYFSLIFSDAKTIMTLWKDFGLLLVESIPVLSIALFLATLSFGLFTFRKLWSESKTVRYTGIAHA